MTAADKAADFSCNRGLSGLVDFAVSAPSTTATDNFMVDSVVCWMDDGSYVGHYFNNYYPDAVLGDLHNLERCRVVM